MTVHIYQGEKFNRTHENQGFDALCRQLISYWGESDEHIVLIGNVNVEGNELDALLLKPDAVAVIDFKNYGGKLSIAENGPWSADGDLVRGGAAMSPFVQIRQNKFALMNWLTRCLPDLKASNNLGHIAGLVLFQQPIDVDESQLPPKVRSWFKVSDLDHVIEWLVALASPDIRLTRENHEAVIKALNVSEYRLPGQHVHVRDLGERTCSVPEALHWSPSQKLALEHASRLLADDYSALIVSGMTSTGKTALVSSLVDCIQQQGAEYVLLAPNAALASRLTAQTGCEFSSIYSHLYDRSAGEEDSKGMTLRPMRSCKDAESTVYVIDEGHLLSDAYFDFGLERLGSGKVISDLIEFSGLGQNQRRLIVLGDPFQLGRGGKDDSLLNEGLLHAKGTRTLTVRLDQMFEEIDRADQLDMARNLISCIRNQHFNSLDLPKNSQQVVRVEESHKAQVFENLLLADGNEGILISYSNQMAQDVNRWARRRKYGVVDELPRPGDRIELFSMLRTSHGDHTIEENLVPAGAIGEVVETQTELESHFVELKGRSEPIHLQFGTLSAKFGGASVKTVTLLYLVPFLLATRPEFDADIAVALRVLAMRNVREQLAPLIRQVDDLKEQAKTNPGVKALLEQKKAELKQLRSSALKQDPYFNCARIRYAYATTCHHAQGKRWEDVLVDASYEGNGRNNEAYFRWLYTAITRASGTVYLANFTPLTVLDQLKVNAANAQLVPSIKSYFNFDYPKHQALGSANADKTLPDGLGADTLELINLWLHLEQCWASEQIQIREIKQHPYQEHYTVQNRAGENAILGFHYNKAFDVTNIRVIGGEESLAHKAKAALQQGLIFKDSHAAVLASALMEKFATAQLEIEGIKESPYNLGMTLVDPHGQRAQLRLHFTKDGMASTLMIEQVTDVSLTEKLISMIQSPAPGMV